MTFFAKINPYLSQFYYSIICKIIATSNRYVMLIDSAIHDCLSSVKIYIAGATLAFGTANDSLFGEACGD